MRTLNSSRRVLQQAAIADCDWRVPHTNGRVISLLIDVALSAMVLGVVSLGGCQMAGLDFARTITPHASQPRL